MKKEKTYRQILNQDDYHNSYKLKIDEENSLTLPVGLLDQLGITDQDIRDFCLEGKLSGLSKGTDNGVVAEIKKEHRIKIIQLVLKAIELGVTDGLRQICKNMRETIRNEQNPFCS